MPRALQQQKSSAHSPLQKVIVPSTSQVLGERASSSSLEQSPSLAKPHWKVSSSFVIHKNGPGTRQYLCCQNCCILSKYLTSPHTLFFQFLVLVPESSEAPNEPAHFCPWTSSVLRVLQVTARRKMVWPRLPTRCVSQGLCWDLGSSCWEFCSNMEAVGRWSLAAAGSASSSYSFLWVPFHNNLNLFSILMLRPSKILLCSWLHAFVTSNCTGSVESYFHYLAFSLFLCNNPLLNVRLCLSSALCLTPATVLPALLSPASIRASQLVLRVFVVICALMSNPEASKRRWDTVSLRAQGCGCLPA